VIEIHTEYSLKEHNTFGISAFAKAYTSITSLQQLKEALNYYGQDIFLLGGGSNMLILEDIERPVIHVNIVGKEIVKRYNDKVLLQVNAGENWHEFVMDCIDQNLAGVENLALIPGNVGTAPIQNIGAYGVELKDVFHSCEVMEIATGITKTLDKADCKFGYRDSIFKNEALHQFVITSVTLELTDLNVTSNYQLKTSYGAIQEELQRLDNNHTIATVAHAVVNIRTSKLPDPKIIGNSGSFFKNPIIPTEQYEDLKRMHPSIPSYKVDESHVKVPAGWLIDQCGFKGKRYGDAGVHDRQALVLVNHGTATGKQIMEVARHIQQKVNDRFGIKVETEVNLIHN
jgi:UDP-N-acetylmuramate dehydrogenase